MFKASELSPRVHHALVRIFHDARVPPGALNKIQVERTAAAEVTEALIAHHAIKKVEFIGSNAIESKIGQLCMEYMKPIFMELGGKCPAIVLEDGSGSGVDLLAYMRLVPYICLERCRVRASVVSEGIWKFADLSHLFCVSALTSVIYHIYCIT